MRLVYSEGALSLPLALFYGGFKAVFAGSGCIMAITSSGKLIPKTAPDVKPVDTYAYDSMNIAKIALSNACPGMSIALDKYGRCRIDQKALERYCAGSTYKMDAIRTIAQWTQVTDVAVSDAFFALDANGRVHVAAINDYNRREYAPVEKWVNIAQIVPGPQNSIFGITMDGNVVCAGCNCLLGPHGDMSPVLAGLRDVVGVGAMGSECGEIIVIFRDGRVKSLFSDMEDRIPVNGGIKVKSNIGCVAVMDGNGELHFYCRERHNEAKFEYLNGKKAEDFALGDIDYIHPFAAVLT